MQQKSQATTRPRDVVRQYAQNKPQMTRPRDLVRNFYNSMPISHLVRGDLQGYGQSLTKASEQFKDPNTALNFITPGAGVIKPVEEKLAGAFVKGSSPIVKGLKDKINKALMGRLHPNSRELMEYLPHLDDEKISTSTIEYVKKLLNK